MNKEYETKFLELLRRSVKSKADVVEMERLRMLFEKELQLEMEDLSVELKNAHSPHTNVWELVNTKQKYLQAINVLIKHLPKQYHDKNKEGIIRALTVKDAKGKANEVLLNEYENLSKHKDDLRWTIGNALYVLITKDDVDRISSIVQDKTNGMSRSRFVEALGKINSERVEALLINLLTDKEMLIFALKALSKLKSQKAKAKIRRLIDSSDKLIKQTAMKALENIG